MKREPTKAEIARCAQKLYDIIAPELAKLPVAERERRLDRLEKHVKAFVARKDREAKVAPRRGKRA